MSRKADKSILFHKAARQLGITEHAVEQFFRGSEKAASRRPSDAKRARLLLESLA